jgi:signal transduction histidine kinase
VADNGVGISQKDAIESGMGLRIMRQRAKLIGAGLEIVTSPDTGTIVSLSLPFAAGYGREARRA